MVKKMSTSKIKDYLKTLIDCEHWYIGKIDDNQEKAIALYANRRPINPISKFRHLQSYTIIPITLLIRWTKNYNNAETKANEIYEILEHRQFESVDYDGFICGLYEGPIDLGTDENGVFKFSIELNFYIKEVKK